MSTLKANIVDSSSSTTEFKDVITANGDKQWIDTYGIIKTNTDRFIEIRILRTELPKVISRILERFEVIDIEIKDPPIEELIGKLFNQRRI